MRSEKNAFIERLNNSKGFCLAAKILTVAAGVAALVLALLDLFGVWEGAISFALILMAAEMLVQCITLWNKSRGIAITNLVAGAITLACSVAALILGALGLG